jgi:hypothetical protein
MEGWAGRLRRWVSRFDAVRGMERRRWWCGGGGSGS